ncbi:MAG: flagellar hook-basal body complex protein FliE [Rhizobiaceae bacterium]|nr:flagellar hook-basal body complex protein FliE [Rhizobiaceae bacterium]
MIGPVAPLKPSTPLDAGGFASGSASASQLAGPSFAEMVASTIGQTIGSMKGAEQLSVDALQGKADLRTVVDAVMSAEQSFQAAVAIRDKIVTAYLEVSRMAI